MGTSRVNTGDYEMTTFTTQDRQDAERDPSEQRWYMVNKDGYVKPLSEEVIKSLYTSWMLTGNDPVVFARAIERAHGIGE